MPSANYLGLDYALEISRRKPPANTSFPGREERARAMSGVELALGDSLLVPAFSGWSAPAQLVIGRRRVGRGEKAAAEGH